MLIRELGLHDFRNYQNAEIHFPAGTSLIEGDNGQGKTNVIEAIYYLATMGSWRTNRDEPLVRDGCETARIEAVTETHSGRSARVAVSLGKERAAVVNGKLDSRRKEIAGIVGATLFAPEDLEIIKGPPAHRRAFIDTFLVQQRPARAGAVTDYSRVLRQRNGLLRSAQASGARDLGTLDVWDRQLAEKGASLAAARRTALSDAMVVAERVYQEACGREGKADFSATYVSSYDLDGGGGAAELENALKASRAEELRRGLTLAGPHHDDIAFAISGLDARTRASQGEQRTAALALRLAEHECISVSRGEEGILLLDDVFSELDAARSRLLIERLEGAQSILTTAGAIPAQARERVTATYSVAAGEIREVS